MNRVKKLLDEAASNILRVTFERGPNGEFSFKGFNPEPPKAELHLPAVDGHVSEMKESSSKESADSGFTEVEPGNLSAEQLIANELVEAKKAKQERKQKKKDKKRRKKNKVAAPIDATDILGTAAVEQPNAGEVVEPREAKQDNREKNKNKRRRRKNKVAALIDSSHDSAIEKTNETPGSVECNDASQIKAAVATAASDPVSRPVPEVTADKPKTMFPHISTVKRPLVQAEGVTSPKAKPDLDALFGVQTIPAITSPLSADSDKYSQIPRHRMKLPNLLAKRKKKTGIVTIPKELVGEDDDVTNVRPNYRYSSQPMKGNVLPPKHSFPDAPPAAPAIKPHFTPCPPKTKKILSHVTRPLPFVKPKIRSVLPHIGTHPGPRVQQQVTRPAPKAETLPAMAPGVPSWWNDPIPTERPKARGGRYDQPPDIFRQRATTDRRHKQQEKPVRKTARDFHTFTWDAYLPRFPASDRTTRREPAPEKAFQRRMRPFGLRTSRTNETDTWVEDLDL